jgi:hypothetical protein
MGFRHGAQETFHSGSEPSGGHVGAVLFTNRDHVNS